MAWALTAERSPARSSACIYRLAGVDPDAEQRWSAYAISRAGVLARRRCSSCTCLQRVQGSLPLVARVPRVSRPTRRSTRRSSFVTNTNWQSYAGESTMGHLVQMAGLAVQNFVSAAVGIAVAVALVRGFARSRDRHDRQLLGRPGPRRPSGSCCRSRSSARVVLIVARGGAELPDAHTRSPRSTGATQPIPGGPVASPGGDQGARHERRRLLQRQLGAPVREPERRSRTCSRSSCCS